MKKQYSIKTTSIMLLTLVLIALGHVNVVSASPSETKSQHKKHITHQPEEKMFQHRFHKMAKALGLSKQQKQEMRAIHLKMKEENKANRTVMNAFKKEARKIIAANKFDESAFKTLYAKYEATFASMAMLKAKARHQSMQLLTDEQQKEWLTLDVGRGKGH